MPPRDNAAVLSSLHYHVKHFADTAYKAGVTIESLLPHAETTMRWLPSVEPDQRFFHGWDLKPFTQEWADHFIDFAYASSNLDSTVGFPWCAHGVHSYDELFAQHGSILPTLIYHRLQARMDFMEGEYQAAYTEDPDYAYPPINLIAMGLHDMTRLFIKNEPTKQSKLREGRPRIICNVSALDIFCTRLLATPLMDACIRDWDLPNRCVCTGMGLDDRSIEKIAYKVASLVKSVEARSGGPAVIESSDTKCHDWSTTAAAIYVGHQALLRKFNPPGPCGFSRAFMYEAVAMGRKIYVSPSGDMLEDRLPGKVSSGSLLTGLLNSVIRTMVEHATGVAGFYAMGDDGVGVRPANQPRTPNQLGYTITYADVPPDALFEFCSHLFKRDGSAEPQNPFKSLFRLLLHKPDRELLAQFKYEMRAWPALPQIVAVLEARWLR